MLPCPACGKNFSATVIQQHANDCLDQPAKEEDDELENWVIVDEQEANRPVKPPERSRLRDRMKNKIKQKKDKILHSSKSKHQTGSILRKENIR